MTLFTKYLVHQRVQLLLDGSLHAIHAFARLYFFVVVVKAEPLQYRDRPLIITVRPLACSAAHLYCRLDVSTFLSSLPTLIVHNWSSSSTPRLGLSTFVHRSKRN